MNKNKPKALVLNGDGINCELETLHALRLVGCEAELVHCFELLSCPTKMKEIKILVLPGGFSFGDEIASGKVLAIKLKEQLQDTLYNFIEKGNLLIGICNGFQILVQLGLLPDSARNAERKVSLVHNAQGKFINKWVELDINSKISPFFNKLTHIHLPIRHGEGRVQLPYQHTSELASQIKALSPLRYSSDVNGSFDKIAGLVNTKGNVLGLMPHPEAFVRWSQHPWWTKLKYEVNNNQANNPLDLKMTPHGLQIWINAFSMVA